MSPRLSKSFIRRAHHQNDKSDDRLAKQRVCGTAESTFRDWAESRTSDFIERVSLTEALLVAAIHGLPTELLSTFLETEYDVHAYSLTKLRELIQLLANDVVYELTPFLEDATLNMIGARQGESFQEVQKHFLNADFPGSSAAALRNQLEPGRRRRPHQHVLKPTPNTRNAADPYEYRAFTLRGRPTRRADQVAVRSQEVFMAADEVMMELAFALVNSRYHLLALAGEEFLLEVAESSVEFERAQVQVVVQQWVDDLLEGVPVSVTVEACDRW